MQAQGAAMTEPTDDLGPEAYQAYRAQLRGEKPKQKKRAGIGRTILAIVGVVIISFVVSVISYMVRAMLAGGN